MRRRAVVPVFAFVFLMSCLAIARVVPRAQQAPPFDLEEATIADLQQRMQSGRETSRSLVDKYLARIEAIDRSGPALASVLELNPEATAIADGLDAERRARGPRGPLHGIPILIKDNIATKDRMMTTAGSLALVGVTPPKDAFIVTKLRQAGAVIVGKTNMSEWANFRSVHSSSGWSGRGGQTKNPYVLDRTPSGSSSGSGAAVAANLTVVAVGTETDGSIVSPSAHNGIVGIKPTLGLVSRFGIVPIAHSQDTAGPMARTVADAAALLAAMSGTDPDDPATKDSAQRGARDYASALDANGLKGARIGIVRNRFFGYNAGVDQLAEAAISLMKAQGAIVVDPVGIASLGLVGQNELDILEYEFKTDLNKYLGWLGAASSVHSLRDVIAFNESRKDQELRYFGQDLLIDSDTKGPLTAAAYTDALAKNQALARGMGIDAAIAEYKLDALVAPTTGPSRPIDLVNGDGDTPGESSPSSIAAIAGYPHITVPMGLVQGLPVGLSFVGPAWSEPMLIKLAYAYEQASKMRRTPTFAPTIDSR